MSASAPTSAAATITALVGLNLNIPESNQIFDVVDGVLKKTKPAPKRWLVCALQNCAGFSAVFRKLKIDTLPLLEKSPAKTDHDTLVAGNQLLADFVKRFNTAQNSEKSRDQRPKALPRIPCVEWLKSVTPLLTIHVVDSAGAGRVIGGAGADRVVSDDDVNSDDKHLADALDEVERAVDSSPAVDPVQAARDADAIAELADTTWVVSSAQDIVGPIEVYLGEFQPLALTLMAIDEAIIHHPELRDCLPRPLIASACAARRACMPLRDAVEYKTDMRLALRAAEKVADDDTRSALVLLAKAQVSSATRTIDLCLRNLADTTTRFSVPRIRNAVTRNIVAFQKTIQDSVSVE
jgi:hypothetical protein